MKIKKKELNTKVLNQIVAAPMEHMSLCCKNCSLKNTDIVFSFVFSGQRELQGEFSLLEQRKKKRNRATTLQLSEVTVTPDRR